MRRNQFPNRACLLNQNEYGPALQPTVVFKVGYNPVMCWLRIRIQSSSHLKAVPAAGPTMSTGCAWPRVKCQSAMFICGQEIGVSAIGRACRKQIGQP